MDSGGPRAGRSWWWLVVLLLTVPVGVAVGAYWLLLSGGVDHQVLRTAATVGVGAGGLVTLGALLHRQRLAQAEHRRQLEDQAHRFQVAADAKEHAERVAATSERDATEKRAQELFLKAVEQLGSEKAAVRIGALHALDALGQEHEHRRRAVMDVWCAYLRMPPPVQRPKAPEDVWPADELQVRATVQRLIAGHLRDPRPEGTHDDEMPGAAGEFWGEMDIDLRAAHLHNFDLVSCRLGLARFDGAIFVGNAKFDQTTFNGPAWFLQAMFNGDARFQQVMFNREAWFLQAMFNRQAWFGRAIFDRSTSFEQAAFNGQAWFYLAPFSKPDFVDLTGRLRLIFDHDIPDGWRAAPPDGSPGRVLERATDS